MTSEIASTDDVSIVVSSDAEYSKFEKRYVRRQSTLTVPGREGRVIKKDAYIGKNKAIGVFTSGGDSQGMNSALRAIVRMGLYVGCRVYFIREGYQGMCDGGENIVEAGWASVSGIIQLGGTVIGSARCADFRERPGRLKAAENLIKLNITNIVCVGGDGSLTGANIFREEWGGFVQELLATGRITEQESLDCACLNIVGMVGSIDNDFCGTDMTIGTDSALHRIIEAVDAIVTTASSHQRCFVMEVMGRHCGYLALVSGLASDADWVLIPEMPPEDGWENVLCEKLKTLREMGQRLNIIIVAEGAVDRQGSPITANGIKDLITEKLNYDTRVTVLGHVQRGGAPSAFDRILACRMGAEAVMALMDAHPGSPACVVSLDGNQTVRIPLMANVKKTQAVNEAMKKHDWQMALELRGRSFRRNWEMYMKLNRLRPRRNTVPPAVPFNLGVVNIGAPCCGMNSAVRAFTRLAIFQGHKVLGIYEGLEGMAQGKVKALAWKDVAGWTSFGGSILGCQKSVPADVGYDRIAHAIAKHEIHALVLVGGFEGYHAVLDLFDHRTEYPEFRIPMVCVPATISNNMPGTDFSLGCDTAVNEITSICDKIKQSAMGSTRRVFVVETMGGYCGYLATMAAIAGGADAAYIFEEKFGIHHLQSDVHHLTAKIRDNVQRGLILRNENANANYTTQFIYNLYSEEGKGIFTARMNVLGHMQQGGVPSPFDRNLGVKMASKALDYVLKLLATRKLGEANEVTTVDWAVVLGVIRKHICFTPVAILRNHTDFEHRLPKEEWWLKLRPLLRIMAKHDSLYEQDYNDQQSSASDSDETDF